MKIVIPKRDLSLSLSLYFSFSLNFSLSLSLSLSLVIHPDKINVSTFLTPTYCVDHDMPCTQHHNHKWSQVLLIVGELLRDNKSKAG